MPSRTNAIFGSSSPQSRIGGSDAASPGAASSMPTLVGDDWNAAPQWQGSQTAAGTNIATVRELVKQGANVNEQDGETGRTPLINAAAFTWDLEIVPFLLSQGADVKAADCQGKTALHHAALNNTAAAASVAQACCSAGADPNAKDAAGNTALTDAKKVKHAAVLAVLDAEAAKPKAVGAAEMEAQRELGWYSGWRDAVFKAVDQCFDADASEVALLGVTGEDDLDVSLAALTADLDAAYRAGKMGGGSFRQVSQERLGPENLVKKLSKLDDEQFVVIAACPAAKRDSVAKKVAKYNKAAEKIVAAWASKEAYPVAP